MKELIWHEVAMFFSYYFTSLSLSANSIEVIFAFNLDSDLLYLASSFKVISLVFSLSALIALIVLTKEANPISKVITALIVGHTAVIICKISLLFFGKPFH